jgi:hypothetical protein
MATDLLVAVAQRAKSALKADREVHLKLARTVVVAVKVVVVVAAKVVVGAAEVAAEAAADREIDRAEDAVVDLALLLAKNRCVFLIILYMDGILSIDRQCNFQCSLELN